MGLYVGEQEEVLPRILDVLAKYAPTLIVRKWQCTTPKRLANLDGGSAKNRSLTLVKKNSQVYCKQLAGSTLRA